MSDHARAFELLPLHALDALPADDHAAVEAHLRGRGDCRRELADQHRVAASLVGDEPAPQHLWTRIEQALDGEQGQDDSWLGV